MSRAGLWVTLAAMTLAGSMILVDQTAVPLASPDVIAALHGGLEESQWILTANVLPLAAFMVFGGQLGDIFGLRRVFLIGALLFAAATAAAGGAQDMVMFLTARALQGVGAALMMPTSIAIVSAAFPPERRGTALGILAGGTAFFAALGPVLGGLLTSVDWRLVFLINVPLAAVAAGLTVAFTPPLRGGRPPPRVDDAGVLLFALGIAAVVFGLSQAPSVGWGDAQVLVGLALGLASLGAFAWLESRRSDPMFDFALFRHRNFLAANLSQVLAGAVELGLGFLLPFYLLLGVGVSPQAAGIALIPSTIPIILAGPLAGRAYDRVGSRVPLVVGFLVLAASGVALSVAADDLSVTALIPGLVLQGIGLGVVLTVNDPTGLNAVPEESRGAAAGMLNTAEQLGGAIGIAALTAVTLHIYYDRLFERLARRGIHPTVAQIDTFREFVVQAEQRGLHGVTTHSRVVTRAIGDSLAARVHAYGITFLFVAGLAVAGALICFSLTRPARAAPRMRILGRRSRWALAAAGDRPATRPGISRA